jgi:RNA polymerase sigma-70 factor (ECF subfamily)
MLINTFQTKNSFKNFIHHSPSKSPTMNTLTQATDNQLVQSFQEGNNNALEILVNRHKDKIFTSINILVKDKYLAEDLMQDVFIKIIDTLRKNNYNDEGKFLPWAMRIAHNLCIDHFRKVKRTPTITTSDDRDIFEVINVCADSADKGIMKRQSHDKVRQLLDLLPEEQKEVIVLRHYANLSFKEIAEMTNCSINTALGRMRYGLLSMRKMMVENHLAL